MYKKTVRPQLRHGVHNFVRKRPPTVRHQNVRTTEHTEDVRKMSGHLNERLSGIRILSGMRLSSEMNTDNSKIRSCSCQIDRYQDFDIFVCFFLANFNGISPFIFFCNFKNGSHMYLISISLAQRFEHLKLCEGVLVVHDEIVFPIHISFHINDVDLTSTVQLLAQFRLAHFGNTAHVLAWKRGEDRMYDWSEIIFRHENLTVQLTCM